MKKLLLSAALLLALSITFTSCKEEAEKTGDALENAAEKTGDAMEDAVDATGDAMEEAGDSMEEAVSGVPSFDNEEVQSYVNAYEDYIESYEEAVESKDMTKMQGLAAKAQELATKGQEAMKNVTGDDMKKLTDYMTEKSNEIMELSKKMTGQ